MTSHIAQCDNTPQPHATHGEGTLRERCTLTDAEREAIEWAIGVTALYDDPCDAPQRHTLRALLERTK